MIMLKQGIDSLDGRYEMTPAARTAAAKRFRTDLTTGEYAGLYLWKSPESLAEFRDSALRASIAAAYQIEGEPRVEVYRVAKTLREEIA
jgi:hypothetical protein